MKSTISSISDYSAIDDLPVRAYLRPIRGFDMYKGMDDDEMVVYNDFMNWHLRQDMTPLLSIPKTRTGDFIPVQLDESGADISAFNTADFHRGKHKFDKYAYKLKKVFERVNDLALMHSCISDEHGRENVKKRCRAVIEVEFMLDLIEAQQKGDCSKARQLMKKVAECVRIWRGWNPA